MIATSPNELRFDHFRQIYLSERTRREAIRSSIGWRRFPSPSSLLGNLVTRFDIERLGKLPRREASTSSCGTCRIPRLVRRPTGGMEKKILAIRADRNRPILLLRWFDRIRPPHDPIPSMKRY